MFSNHPSGSKHQHAGTLADTDSWHPSFANSGSLSVPLPTPAAAAASTSTTPADPTSPVSADQATASTPLRGNSSPRIMNLADLAKAAMSQAQAAPASSSSAANPPAPQPQAAMTTSEHIMDDTAATLPAGGPSEANLLEHGASVDPAVPAVPGPVSSHGQVISTTDCATTFRPDEDVLEHHQHETLGRSTAERGLGNILRQRGSLDGAKEGNASNRAGWGRLRHAVNVASRWNAVHAGSVRIQALPGASPGIDVDSESTDQFFRERLQAPVRGIIVDFNNDRVAVEDNLSNISFPGALQSKRPEWARVRWIHVEGISWEVLKPLAKKYRLHPLSVEDVLHTPQRSKVDHYPAHLFVSMLVCRMVAHEQVVAEQNGTPGLSRARSITSAEPTVRVSAPPALARKALSSKLSEQEKLAQFDLVVDYCSMFMLDDGTLISMMRHDGSFITQPILDRLSDARTNLRSFCDVSFLLQSLMDVIVDHYLPISEAYVQQFEKVEALVFDKPTIDLVKHLHSVQNDLLDVQRKLQPVAAIIRSLRHLDEQAAGNTNVSAARITPMTRLYLNDVQDHITTVLENIHSLHEWSESMINLTFNTLAFLTNENMKALTAVSILFIPITFLAGVYGMNFTHFPGIEDENGYYYFWATCAVIVLVSAGYLRWKHFL
ncbi:hypothetical protein AMAG_03288 [Allomyces macrogynus ATCC 38327]|uniref:Magnesium and cobalt transporter CorA n=1 Tax=Allomyces macrogynus (strain ATCC 38327) TaxID=578462 RepID=A0A0L0S4Y9_ALLM3|nr:hypothetical protein AMAG_03288 [Allomyces macrogynus ATCC 38327]|eukprot:KNE57598.1 hypothetical protein AMAG_03288 [Allomyces macrogynus ATCC 38327]